MPSRQIQEKSLKEITRVVIAPAIGKTWDKESGQLIDVSTRGYYAIDDLAEELNKELPVPVVIIERDYQYHAGDFLICWLDQMRKIMADGVNAQKMISNSILIHEPELNDEVLALFQKYDLAGWLDESSFIRWEYMRGVPESVNPMILGKSGLESVLSDMIWTVECLSFYKGLVHYEGHNHITLPQTLGAYIQAYVTARDMKL